VAEKEKITQLFKKMQHSFSELLFHARQVASEARDLETLKDFFKVRVDYLK